MRIISQDGTVDVPYESVVIQRHGKNIYFLNNNLTGVEKPIDDMTLAKYSTEEKAQKVMVLLRDKYLSYMVLDGGYNEVHDCYVQPNYWVLPRVFQFPQDDEVEVNVDVAL